MVKLGDRVRLGLAIGLAGIHAAPVLAQGAAAERRAAIEARLSRLEATKAIERLQYAYGYYQDRFFFAEVASLFAANGASVQWGDRVWSGSPAVRKFWIGYMGSTIAGGAAGPVAGKLFDLPQWQGVITVDADGNGASAQFNTIGRYAVYREKEYWISGFFQNRYVREGSVWKIQAMKFCPNWSARYTDGWRDVTEADALAWLPPPRSARPTRDAHADERCPAAFPGNREIELDFHQPQRFGAR